MLLKYLQVAWLDVSCLGWNSPILFTYGEGSAAFSTADGRPSRLLMGTVLALQSMPHEKRTPLGYVEYSLNSTAAIGSASSDTIETFSDSSSQFSWRPLASQSSAQTTPDSLSSDRNPGQPDAACLESLRDPIHAVDVPSWRHEVEKENQNFASILPSSQRRNSRRTGPGSEGADSRQITPPSTLVRQPERRHCFVSSLVIFAAGLIAAIWPLSVPVFHDTTYAHNVLPLQDFITETLRRSKTSYSTLQVAMYYLILLKGHLPKCDFTQEQSCVPPNRRAMQCGRRMFLSALMLASKFLQDRNYSTRAWGKITGLPTSEINKNEFGFLDAVEWKLHVTKQKFERWSHSVIALSAPPRPGASLIPQPSLVETIGWSAVLDRLTPDCLDDFSRWTDGSALLADQSYQPALYGMLTPPTSPPESIASDQEYSSERLETSPGLSDTVATKQSIPAYPAPPPTPHQQNLPTPRSTPGLPRSMSSLSQVPRGVVRCRDSSSAMALLKLCARPANRTLCPPPSQRPCQPSGQAGRPSTSRSSSISTPTTSNPSSSPESVRSDLSSLPARSRSSSISSVASSLLAPSHGSDMPGSFSGDVGLPSCPQRYVHPPKLDCSSTLRPEEYSAADALLRFHDSRQREANRGQAGTGPDDSMRTKLGKWSMQASHPLTQSASSVERKKKRTHSKTNISDLLNVSGDDLQSLVRKDLMASYDEVSGIVIPDVDSRLNVGRQSKRTRSCRTQSSAVDSTRVLM